MHELISLKAETLSTANFKLYAKCENSNTQACISLKLAAC